MVSSSQVKRSSKIDRHYPYQVEILVPPRRPGFGANIMYGFCWTRGFAFAKKKAGRQPGDRAMRWCFVELSHAAAFHKEFGGDQYVVHCF